MKVEKKEEGVSGVREFSVWWFFVLVVGGGVGLLALTVWLSPSAVQRAPVSYAPPVETRYAQCSLDLAKDPDPRIQSFCASAQAKEESWEKAQGPAYAAAKARREAWEQAHP